MITTYQIACVGMPGRGKTMAFRNMNPETTGYINMESKPLPYLNKYKHYCTPNNWQEAYQKLIEYAKNKDIEQVVFDSFSSYVDSLLKTARETKKNFEVWNLYNEEIGNLLYIFKKYPKFLFVTAHYEWVQNESGAIEKRIKVKGKEWEGMIEKEFTIVHYADIRVLNGKREYLLEIQCDGKNSTKTPPMFLSSEEQNTIENDYAVFLEIMKKKLNE